MNDLVRKAIDVNQRLLALGSETFEAAGGVFVRNRDVPRIYDANHVAAVTASAPDEIDALLGRVEQEYAHLPYRRFDTDPFTPPEVEARLAYEGYDPGSPALFLILEGELRGEPKPCDIRPVESDADWAAYETLDNADWIEEAEKRERPAGLNISADMCRVRRAKSPKARFWMAYVEDRPAAYFMSWEGIEGVGQVEDLFTLPEFRHRGLATALIHHSVADCRKHGAGPVLIVARPDDTPKRMYRALGFRPLCLTRNYFKQLS
jgi:GNAT superfamily N-acetyltransferase